MYFTKIFENLNFYNNSSGNKIIQKGSGNTQNVTISKNDNEFSYSERRTAAEKLLKAVRQYCSYLLEPDSREQIPQVCKTRVEGAMSEFLPKLDEEDQKKFYGLIKPLLELNKKDLNQSKDLIKKNQQEIISLLKTTYIE
jgi:predicted nuclease with TOPRIM domain